MRTHFPPLLHLEFTVGIEGRCLWLTAPRPTIRHPRVTDERHNLPLPQRHFEGPCLLRSVWRELASATIW